MAEMVRLETAEKYRADAEAAERKLAALTAAVREVLDRLGQHHMTDEEYVVASEYDGRLRAVLDAADTTALDRVKADVWDEALRWVRAQADVTSPEYVLDRIDRAEPFNPHRADAQTSEEGRRG